MCCICYIISCEPEFKGQSFHIDECPIHRWFNDKKTSDLRVRWLSRVFVALHNSKNSVSPSLINEVFSSKSLAIYSLSTITRIFVMVCTCQLLQVFLKESVGFCVKYWLVFTNAYNFNSDSIKKRRECEFKCICYNKFTRSADWAPQNTHWLIQGTLISKCSSEYK